LSPLLFNFVLSSGSQTFCVTVHFLSEKFVTEHYRRHYTKSTYVHIWLFLPNCFYLHNVAISG
jgi:hypothetical protein